MGEIGRQQSVEDINRLEATVDDWALYGRRYGSIPMQAIYNKRFGPEGTGWIPEVIEKPRNMGEKLASNMELGIIDVWATPQGDALDMAQQLSQRM